ncbi:ribonuclease H-like domain-containing protein [Tanacetum coccineum]
MAIMIGSLDQGNPLHLHPYDSNCASIVSVKLTWVENYRIWASAMKLALQIKHKMGFVNGTCVRCSYLASAPLVEYWDRCNDVVLNWILSSLSQDVYLGHVFLIMLKLFGMNWKKLMIGLMVQLCLIQFDILTKLPDCVCTARAELGGHGKLMQFLMGLDDVYQPIRSSLLTREVLPEVKDAFVILAREESHRGIPATTAKSDKPQASVFVSRVNDVKRSNWNANWNNGNTSNNNRGNYNSLLFVKLMNLLNDKSGSTAHANMAGVSYHFRWIIDSGANQHMTNNIKNMNHVVDVTGLNLTVGHPKGTLAKITHISNLRLNNNVIWFDVLVIPEYCDLKRETVLKTGSESTGLYLFDVDCDKIAVSNKSKYFVCYVSKDVWHNRLGHPANQVLTSTY